MPPVLAKSLDKFFEALEQIVDNNAPWQEKRDAVLAYTKEDSRAESHFEEFLEWFADDDKGNDNKEE